MKFQNHFYLFLSIYQKSHRNFNIMMKIADYLYKTVLIYLIKYVLW